MKSFVVSTAILLSSFSVLAEASPEAERAFLTDSQVIQAIEQAKAQDLNVATVPDSAFVGGGCGFAGCDAVYLVTLSTSTKGANPQSTVISALVTTHTANTFPPEVRMIDIGNILSQ
ncbi:MAG: hypothetical protein AB7G93_16540 [Bdellovibrionales bacterium]